MKTKLSHSWKKISENGISENLVYSEKKRIRILNRIIFINALLSFLFLIIDLLNNSFEGFLISLSTLLISIILLLLIHKKLITISKWIILLFLIIFISSITILTGKDSGTIIYFVPGILFPAIIFQNKKLILILSIFFIILLISVFWLGQLIDPLIKLSHYEKTYYQISSLIGGTLITFLIIWFIRTTNIEYEEIIIEHNKNLNHSNNKINQQKLKLEIKNKDLTDSINYASRIQQAILPNNKKISRFFKNHFLLYLPKDIVSGDFYWMEEANNQIYLAIADCTGHGIPGAMVSVVCNNALNRSIQKFKLTAPKAILNKTRELVIDAFEDNDQTIRDGMDIALCCIDKTNNKLTFSGANNPIIIIRENKTITLHADRQPIGKYSFGKSFNQQEISLNTDDTIYLFTDGFYDQFGGERGKKYKSDTLKKFLLKNSSFTLKKQKELLLSEFNNWKGNLEQIDDVCIMGVKI